MANQKKNRIPDLDPAHLREVDGVVFDLDSFARHCAPHPTGMPAPAPIPEPPDAPSVPASPVPEAFPAQDTAPAPVFLCEPVHAGWYETYPIMAGAIPPAADGAAVWLTRPCGSGSFASSYAASYATSYVTAYRTSFGSYLTTLSTSYRTSFPSSGLCILAGGYGLELI